MKTLRLATLVLFFLAALAACQPNEPTPEPGDITESQVQAEPGTYKRALDIPAAVKEAEGRVRKMYPKAEFAIAYEAPFVLVKVHGPQEKEIAEALYKSAGFALTFQLIEDGW